jgi:hypothetical protein
MHLIMQTLLLATQMTSWKQSNILHPMELRFIFETNLPEITGLVKNESIQKPGWVTARFILRFRQVNWRDLNYL